MKHKLLLDDGTDLGIIYLYGPIPYIGLTFVFGGKGFKILGIQGSAFTELQKDMVDVTLIATEIPRIYQ